MLNAIILAALTVAPVFTNHNRVAGNVMVMTNMQEWASNVSAFAESSLTFEDLSFTNDFVRSGGKVNWSDVTNADRVVVREQDTTSSKGYTAVTLGKARDTGTRIKVGQYSVTEGGAHYAQGPYSHAEGLGFVDTAGTAAHAEGTSTASAIYAHAEGASTEASGPYSHSEGWYSVASNRTSFAWNGKEVDFDLLDDEDFENETYRYGSHGDGTFNINPTNGLAGFWIGETNAIGHITNVVGSCGFAKSTELTNAVNAVKSQFYDEPLGVTWTLKMENGSMKLYATTNVNTSTLPSYTNWSTDNLPSGVAWDAQPTYDASIDLWNWGYGGGSEGALSEEGGANATFLTFGYGEGFTTTRSVIQ